MRILVSLLLFVAVSAVQAQPLPPVYQARYEAPGQVLYQGVEALRAYLQQGPSPEALGRFLEQRIAPAFDFGTMARWVAGPLARQLTPEQQAALRDTLRQQFLRSSAGHLAGYGGARIEYLRPRGNPQSRFVDLGIRVHPPRGYAVTLTFRLQRGADGWRVVDVLADGNSAVAHYRSLVLETARRVGVEGMLRRLAG